MFGQRKDTEHRFHRVTITILASLALWAISIGVTQAAGGNACFLQEVSARNQKIISQDAIDTQQAIFDKPTKATDQACLSDIIAGGGNSGLIMGVLTNIAGSFLGGGNCISLGDVWNDTITQIEDSIADLPYGISGLASSGPGGSGITGGGGSVVAPSTVPVSGSPSGASLSTPVPPSSLPSNPQQGFSIFGN